MRNREPTAQEGFEPYGEYAAAPGAQQPASSQDAGLRTQAQKRRRTSLMFKLLVLLTCLCIMLIVLQETVFRLQAVYVVGNETRTPQEVAAASGLVRGRSIFSITREEVEASLSRDHTLIFEDMQIQYPNTVYLYVRERTPAAVMSWLGILYLLDDEGMVMSQISADQAPQDMPEVTGLRLTDVVVGRVLSSTSQDQLQAYREIMLELYEQMYLTQVSQINLADPDSLFLETREGITVHLGDRSHMQAKICAMRTYMSYFRQLGENSGLLDVTKPEDAKFQPDL